MIVPLQQYLSQNALIVQIYGVYPVGLCGNFNGDPFDDFMIRETHELTDDVNEFAVSYKSDIK